MWHMYITAQTRLYRPLLLLFPPYLLFISSPCQGIEQCIPQYTAASTPCVQSFSNTPLSLHDDYTNDVVSSLLLPKSPTSNVVETHCYMNESRGASWYVPQGQIKSGHFSNVGLCQLNPAKPSCGQACKAIIKQAYKYSSSYCSTSLGELLAILGHRRSLQGIVQHTVLHSSHSSHITVRSRKCWHWWLYIQAPCIPGIELASDHEKELKLDITYVVVVVWHLSKNDYKC